MRIEDIKLTVVENWLSKQKTIKRAWIFGSYAKGLQTDKSDLDIAIEIEALDGENLAEWCCNAQKWKKQLANLVGSKVTIDLQAAFYNDQIVMPAVLEHGKLIYRRTKP